MLHLVKETKGEVKRLKELSRETQAALLEAMIDGSKVGTIVTDPAQPDNPIIYTNKTFIEMTGYTRGEVVGRNCRFLQGPGTAKEDIEKMKKAIANEEKVIVTVQNYRKDDSPFWNRLVIEPVHIEGNLYFIGTQTDITLERSQQQAIMANEDEIEKLMLPILSIQENVATVALVGTMNFQRFETLKVKICEYAQEHHIEHAIIDITGLTWNEKSPLYWFIQIYEALRIMGSKLYVTGISPAAAQQFVTDSDRDSRLVTFSTIERALNFIAQNADGGNHIS
ncbi:blue-light photoreceptor [Planococcus antarcticus DSM 14505]|uniref:Blue-light photoreceptor n=1 Tax=Planococcus antarcticus DSM 14505 TaxID=1185653 RepID=A0AA87IMR3_9BACL|nr:PAS domain-containing protein [Planococcus antarcticus]EIM07555.1 blue-light photoreceptor [Planococcus antarcticus DSM 14505]